MWNLMPGTYDFECCLMPWTKFEIGERYVGDKPIVVSLELNYEELQSLVETLHWAWDNEWFEHSMSETVCTELIQLRAHDIYDRVYPIAHQSFCELFPNCENVQGFGVYEIFIPDEIVDYASDTYSDSDL